MPSWLILIQAYILSCAARPTLKNSYTLVEITEEYWCRQWDQGDDSIKIYRLTSIGIPIIKVRQSHDCVIFIMEVPILVRWHHYIDSCLKGFNSFCSWISHSLALQTLSIILCVSGGVWGLDFFLEQTGLISWLLMLCNFISNWPSATAVLTMLSR